MAEPCIKLTCDRQMSQAGAGMKVSTVVFRLIFQTKHFWARLVEKMALQKNIELPAPPAGQRRAGVKAMLVSPLSSASGWRLA